mgnify:CR=1 FL=1
MRKIELNMSENIATSGEIIGYHFLTKMRGCTIQDTGFYIYDDFTDSEVSSCLMYASDASAIGTVVPEAEVRLYMRH